MIQIKFDDNTLNDIVIRVMRGHTSQAIATDIGKSLTWVKELRSRPEFHQKRETFANILEAMHPPSKPINTPETPEGNPPVSYANPKPPSNQPV